MQRSELIAQIDEYVFDYGLIVGHEDCRLRGFETADIFITFVHRTIQEFLGSFYFVQMLSEGLLPPDDKKPILLYNSMVLEFCAWLISDRSDLLPIANSTKAGAALKSFLLQYIDFCQKDLHEIALLYPALKMPIFDYGSKFTNSDLCLELLQECKNVKELHLGSNCWVLKEMKKSIQNLNSIVMIDEKIILQSFEDSSNELQIVIRDDTYEVETIDKLLEYSKLTEKRPSLYSIITSPGSDDCYPIEMSTFMYDNLRSLFFVSKSGGYRVIANRSIVAMPFLTHLNLINVILADGSVMKSLSQAVEAGNFPNLLHISFAGSEINGTLSLLFTNKWPALQHLDLHRCNLKMSDIEALGAATDKEKPECVLPNLSSLVLFTLWIENNRHVIGNLFLSHPWKHLTDLAIWFLTREHYENLTEAIRCSKFPSLSQLSLSMIWNLDQNQHFDGFNSKCIPLLREIKLKRFIVANSGSEPWCDNVMRQNLCRIDLRQCSGVEEMLSEVLNYSFPHLKTLILRNCELKRLDLRCLANANVAGRLPELRHLDISDNEELQGQLNEFFNCTWKSLLRLNVEQENVKDAEIKNLSDVRTLLSELESGTLKSLREVRFTTGSKHPFPVNSKTPFTELTKITVVTTAWPVQNVVNTMTDLVDDGMFPSLQIFRVVSDSDSYYHCRHARHRLRRCGVKVYISRSGAESIEELVSWE